MLLVSATDLYFRDCYIRGLSIKTIKGYKDHLRIFCSFAGESFDLDRFNFDFYTDYAARIRARGVSAGTLSSYIRSLKIFVRWCIKRGFVNNFDIDSIVVPKMPKKKVHIYSDDEIVMILDSFGSDWLGSRDRALTLLMLDSGLRRLETIAVRLNDFNENSLVVHGKGNKDRVVPVGSSSADAIRQYVNDCPFDIKDYLFLERRGERMTLNAVKLMAARHARKLPFDFSCHRLRHNFATNYCLDAYDRDGHVDIYSLMMLMGHEDISTTRKYLHYASGIYAAKHHRSHLDQILMRC